MKTIYEIYELIRDKITEENNNNPNSVFRDWDSPKLYDNILFTSETHKHILLKYENITWERFTQKQYLTNVVFSINYVQKGDKENKNIFALAERMDQLLFADNGLEKRLIKVQDEQIVDPETSYIAYDYFKWKSTYKIQLESNHLEEKYGEKQLEEINLYAMDTDYPIEDPNPIIREYHKKN